MDGNVGEWSSSPSWWIWPVSILYKDDPPSHKYRFGKLVLEPRARSGADKWTLPSMEFVLSTYCKGKLQSKVRYPVFLHLESNVLRRTIPRDVPSAKESVPNLNGFRSTKERVLFMYRLRSKPATYSIAKYCWPFFTVVAMRTICGYSKFMALLETQQEIVCIVSKNLNRHFFSPL